MSTCECPDPPGGRAVCEPGQLAVCRIVGGSCQAECHNPPSLTTAQQIREWAFAVIAHQPPGTLSGQEEAILDSGVYQDPFTGDEVHFTLP